MTPVSLECRFCGAPLDHVFVDLGMSPLCQTHIEASHLHDMEPFYPLRVYLCTQCYLVQLSEYVAPEKIFTEYAYFSSYADTWLAHCKEYCTMAIQRFGLGSNSLVVELASNDGYLLQYFRDKGIPVLGVEPAANVARVAIEHGIPTEVKFFGVAVARELAGRRGKADLIVGNNVLAHVPGLNDFVGGMKVMLGEHGVLTMEFPHLFQLMEHNQFDTIYHEHFSYFSFTAVERVFNHHGLTLFDVEELPTHGGSLRIYGRHQEAAEHPVTDRVRNLLRREKAQGVDTLQLYELFRNRVEKTKRNLLALLVELKGKGKTIAGYGAPGKGNTLLNYCGIRADFLDYTVDRNPYKQGKFTPGTHIPIYPPDKLKETRPDYVLILPWNLKDEIVEQHSYIRSWGGKFIVPIPDATVLP